MGVKLLENVYEMVCESRMMYGVEIWGIEERWKEVGKIHGRMCKKVLGIPRFAANGVAELELGRDSRRCKVMITLVKCWQRILQMDKNDLVRVCHDWQINNAQYDGWAKKLEKELNQIGLGHIWRNPTENQRGTVCKEVKERCNDIERQIFFANLSEKRSLIFYRDMKLLWDKEHYVMCGSRNDRMGIAWFRASIWKWRGIRKGLEIGRCPQFLSRKWQIINEELGYKKIINCTNTVELRNLGRYLYKIKCKWENRIKEFQLDGE
jgi:hypothetical protein